jgi:hypothetical protein
MLTSALTFVLQHSILCMSMHVAIAAPVTATTIKEFIDIFFTFLLRD